MKSEDTALLILAAGRSMRFGTEDKLLADLGGKPLGLHAADALTPVAFWQRIAVASGEIARMLRARGFTVVAPAPDAGIGDNIAAGVAALGDVQGVAIVLADMPFVTAEHLTRLLAEAGDATIAVSSDGRMTSPPIVFPAGCFGALRALHGDEGARPVIVNAGLAVVRVAAAERLLKDIDTPQALEAARGTD